jgi:hypothetical protein
LYIIIVPFSFLRAYHCSFFFVVATLDKKLNDLDDKLSEVTGGHRNEDDDIDYTGGDANDILYNNKVGQIESNVSPPDLREISDAAMNVGKTAASFLAEKVGVAATSIRMHQSIGGRPPFVMTAVEDDDDEYVEGEEYSDDCDEEELGWSESEEEEEAAAECDSGDDEVDFTNIEGRSQPQLPLESLDVVKMRENLKNAEEERNQFLQLVEDRNQEICNLKLALDQCNSRYESSPYPDVQSLDDLRREVLWFRKLVVVTRKEESPTELKSILSEMRNKVLKQQNVADLEMKIQTVKDTLATSYAKIDQFLLVREEVKQTGLKERMERLEGIMGALQKEIEENRDQMQLQQQALVEQPAREIVEQIVSPRDSPSSSTSSGVLIGKDGIVEND